MRSCCRRTAGASLSRTAAEFAVAPVCALVPEAAAPGDLPDHGSLVQLDRPGLVVTGIVMHPGEKTLLASSWAGMFLVFTISESIFFFQGVQEL